MNLDVQWNMLSSSTYEQEKLTYSKDNYSTAVISTSLCLCILHVYVYTYLSIYFFPPPLLHSPASVGFLYARKASKTSTITARKPWGFDTKIPPDDSPTLYDVYFTSVWGTHTAQWAHYHATGFICSWGWDGIRCIFFYANIEISVLLWSNSVVASRSNRYFSQWYIFLMSPTWKYSVMKGENDVFKKALTTVSVSIVKLGVTNKQSQ